MMVTVEGYITICNAGCSSVGLALDMLLPVLSVAVRYCCTAQQKPA